MHTPRTARTDVETHSHAGEHEGGCCGGKGVCGGKGKETGQCCETDTAPASFVGVSKRPKLESIESVAALPVPQLIARYRVGIDNFDRRLFQLTAEQMDMAFLPDADVGRWPVRVLVGHVADADLAQAHRMRRAVGEDNPVLSLWDEDAFIDNDVYGMKQDLSHLPPEVRSDRVKKSVGGAIAFLHTTRQWMGQWLASLSETQWQRKAMHPQRGPQTVKDMVAVMTWHLEHHAIYLNAKVEKMLGPDAGEPSGGCGSGCGCKH